MNIKTKHKHIHRMDYFKIITLHNNKLIVYDNGLILNLRTRKIIKGSVNNIGYKCTELQDNGNRYSYKIHRIVAYAYKGLDITNPDIKVDHINGIKTDNRFENLRYGTQQQNMFNLTKAKGYHKTKDGKYVAQIKLDGKCKYLGRFNSPVVARMAYLTAKNHYHQI